MKVTSETSETRLMILSEMTAADLGGESRRRHEFGVAAAGTVTALAQAAETC